MSTPGREKDEDYAEDTVGCDRGTAPGIGGRGKQSRATAMKAASDHGPAGRSGHGRQRPGRHGRRALSPPFASP